STEGCASLSHRDYGKIIFEDNKPVDNWKSVVPLASETCLSLLRKLIVYSAEERYSAEVVLQHEFFIVDIPKQAPYIPPPMSLKIPQQMDPIELDLDAGFVQY
ncbi:hypothetical protein WUBG_16139, partial [Wuchereria bancrofti]